MAAGRSEAARVRAAAAGRLIRPGRDGADPKTPGEGCPDREGGRGGGRPEDEGRMTAVGPARPVRGKDWPRKPARRDGFAELASLSSPSARPVQGFFLRVASGEHYDLLRAGLTPGSHPFFVEYHSMQNHREVPAGGDRAGSRAAGRGQRSSAPAARCRPLAKAIEAAMPTPARASDEGSGTAVVAPMNRAAGAEAQVARRPPGTRRRCLRSIVYTLLPPKP